MAKKQQVGGATPKRARKTALTSVYPRQFAVAILGATGSKVFNQAIESWAMVLAHATDANACTITGQEWSLLAGVWRQMDRKPDTGDKAPDVWLVKLVEDGGSIFGEMFQAKVRNSLVKKLAGLDYIRAWAVIYAVQWAVEEGHDEGDAEWWTVAFRGQHQTASGKG